jgi:hypothetical protein
MVSLRGRWIDENTDVTARTLSCSISSRFAGIAFSEHTDEDSATPSRHT